MNIQTLPNGFVIDMDEILYIMSGSVELTGNKTCKLRVKCAHAEVILESTPSEHEELIQVILDDIDRRIEEEQQQKKGRL